MKYCKNCGAKSENDVKFCPHCGKSVFIETDDNNCCTQQKSFWLKAFSINGRLNRLKHFIYRLKVLGVIILGMIPLAVMTKTSLDGLGFLIFGIATIAAIISSITIMIRRLHDLNFSGWLIIPYFIVLTICRESQSEGVLLIALPASVIFELFLFFAKGTTGVNKYGEDPLKTK